jgi:hypothetical protein
MHYNSFTFRLIKRKPTLLNGISALLNLFGTGKSYCLDTSEKLADFNSIESDWSAVGEDMQESINSVITAQ